MENELSLLVMEIELLSLNTQLFEKRFNKKIKAITTLENYLDLTKDKNLDSSLYQLFGYDDEEIFEMDYEFLINNVYN